MEQLNKKDKILLKEYNNLVKTNVSILAEFKKHTEGMFMHLFGQEEYKSKEFIKYVHWLFGLYMNNLFSSNENIILKIDHLRREEK